MGWGMGRTDRDHARFAERDPCREKECRAPPYDKLGGTLVFTWSQWRDGSAVSFLQAANVALVRLT